MLLFTSCGPSGSSFRIKGKFRDMQTGELYIYNLSDDHARLDTLTIQEGRFLYRGEAEDVTPYMLVFPNGVEQVIFVSPATDIEYEATANDLKNYVVNGSDENKLMNLFRQETYTQNPSEAKVTARKYIKENPTSAVAIYLLHSYFVQDEEVSSAEIHELLKVLKKAQPHHHYLLDIDSKVSSIQRREEGKLLPDVTLTPKDRHPVKLWSKSKPYNLVAFWALWMPSGYDLLWKLRLIQDKYTSDGNLRIVAVSLDLERFRWEEAIRPDSTAHIEHYCDGLAFESKAIKTLGVQALPFYVLTDKTHRVLDSGTEVAQLEEMVRKHLKGENPDPSKK